MTSERIIIRKGDLFIYDSRLRLVALEDLDFFKHDDHSDDVLRHYFLDVYNVDEGCVNELGLWNVRDIELLARMQK